MNVVVWQVILNCSRRTAAGGLTRRRISPLYKVLDRLLRR